MSLKLNLPGLIIPPLTPFNDQQQVDYQLLEKGVHYVVQDCNAAMVIAAGVEAQEYHYLKFEERKELIKRTIEFVDNRCPVAVGISHPSYKIAIELAHYAQDLGAQAVQLLAPLRAFGGEPAHQDRSGQRQRQRDDRRQRTSRDLCEQGGGSHVPPCPVRYPQTVAAIRCRQDPRQQYRHLSQGALTPGTAVVQAGWRPQRRADDRRAQHDRRGQPGDRRARPAPRFRGAVGRPDR